MLHGIVVVHGHSLYVLRLRLLRHWLNRLKHLLRLHGLCLQLLLLLRSLGLDDEASPPMWAWAEQSLSRVMHDLSRHDDLSGRQDRSLWLRCEVVLRGRAVHGTRRWVHHHDLDRLFQDLF
jgi:hypothetical protein